MVVRGSSPLTRGKREAETGERVLGGLIPAHAGKTLVQSLLHVPVPAHPRSRGENIRDTFQVHPSGGSSPLTRGKRRANR